MQIFTLANGSGCCETNDESRARECGCGGDEASANGDSAGRCSGSGTPIGGNGAHGRGHGTYEWDSLNSCGEQGGALHNCGGEWGCCAAKYEKYCFAKNANFTNISTACPQVNASVAMDEFEETAPGDLKK